MSSVHKLGGKANWICFYTDHEGRRRCKSTLTTNKQEADRICHEIQKIENKARARRLTPERAHKVISQVVADVMESLGTPIERRTIQEHFEGWISTKQASSGTLVRYQQIVRQFLAFLGPKSNKDLSSLAAEEIEGYRDGLQGTIAPTSVNVHLKVIRVCLESATRKSTFDKNPARLVDNLPSNDRHERRGFTLAELNKVLAVCGDDWRTAVLLGIYTGLRLGDIQALTWANLDLLNTELTTRTRKTGRVQILPIAKPLLRQIESLPVGDDPKAPLCPALQNKTVSWLSNQFHEILASAGLVQSRGDHQKKEGKSGRAGRRQMSPFSFHSLRHTATSLLKNAGVSDVVARDIIGHESEAVSRNYTHIDMETKRKAVDAMPDVLAIEAETKPAGSSKRPPASKQRPPAKKTEP
jgi:integrase